MARQSERRKGKAGQEDEEFDPNFVLRARKQEQLLIDVLPELTGERVICNTVGRAQFAETYARLRPAATVRCLFLDLYQRNLSADAIFRDLHVPYEDDDGDDDTLYGAADPIEPEAESGGDGASSEESDEDWAPPLANLFLDCEPDFPDGDADLAALAFGRFGEAELTRDLLQQARQRLVVGGRLVASTDRDDDQWLHTELKRLFPKVTRRTFRKKGTLYLATRVDEPVKYKSFDCEFAFRDQGRLIKAFSRPSVFSHRRIDTGARALINAMEIRPRMKVLDIGCGAGVVGIAAALRAENVDVTAVDCNPRAVQSAERGAAANGVSDHFEGLLDADGSHLEANWFDLSLANPPYFSNWRIAEHFLQASLWGLKPLGEILVVTKTPHWFAERMPQLFTHVAGEQVKDYWLLRGRKPADTRVRQPDGTVDSRVTPDP